MYRNFRDQVNDPEGLDSGCRHCRDWHADALPSPARVERRRLRKLVLELPPSGNLNSSLLQLLMGRGAET